MLCIHTNRLLCKASARACPPRCVMRGARRVVLFSPSCSRLYLHGHQSIVQLVDLLLALGLPRLIR
jgi:hypothetical protein